MPPLTLVAPSESSLFDTIGGLPLHPLVVHVAVVFLPVAALALIALVFVPRWRRTFGWVTLAGLAIGTVGAIVSKESGDALAEQVGTPARHADLGHDLPLVSIALFVLALAWFLLDRWATGRDPKVSMGVRLLGYLTAIVAAGTIVLTVLVGHSGAEAAWGGRVPAAADSSATTSDAATTSGETTASAALTLSDVQAHSSPSDCWTVVAGKVYDLTDWVNQHPGGAGNIESMCGIDATSAFEGEHGGEGRPNRELEQFLLGPLAASTAAGTTIAVTPVVYTSATVAEQPVAVATAKKYTRKQVRRHNTATNCWTIINRKVYNLTDWVKRHPGGSSRIIAICGKDGSAAFNGKHTGDRRPAAELKRYQIGVLR